MAVGVLVWIERKQRARRTLASRSWRPAQVQVLEGWPAWRASALCFFPILIAFVGPVAILLHALEPLAPEQFARLGQWLQHSILLAALSVWVIIPAAVLLAYVGRLNPSGWVKSITALANAGYALPGVVIGVYIKHFGLARKLAPLTQRVAWAWSLARPVAAEIGRAHV